MTLWRMCSRKLFGDGYCDGTDQAFGYDLTCYDNADGGDAGDGDGDGDGDGG